MHTRPRGAGSSQRPRARSILFLAGGEERPVPVRAPAIVWRDGRRMVQLIDLWVASLLPGDLLDLGFEIVTAGPDGELRCSKPLDATRFARGFLDIATCELWWDDPGDCELSGTRALSVVVGPPTPPAAPEIPAPAPTVRSLSVSELHRLLPVTARGYPPVEVRNAPLEAEEPARGPGVRIAC